MMKQAVLAAIAIGLSVSVTAQASGGKDIESQPKYEAKAKFIKKCFRDRTKLSCEAPPDARIRAKN